MGQQQLLLLVLSVVIVGLAITLGMTIYDQNARKNAEGALIKRGIEVATHAKAWRDKPSPYSGGGQSYSGLAEDSFQKLQLEEETQEGRFAVESASENELVLIGQHPRFLDIGVRITIQGSEIVSTDAKHDGSITLGGS